MSTITLDVPQQRRPRRSDSVDEYAGCEARPVRGAVPARPSEVRLTRRGRLVVFLASLALVLGASVAFGSWSVATDESGEPPATEIVQVTPGQTLWGIASERAEHGGEVRDVMQQIERLNALESGMLRVGQKLRVPVAD